MVGRTLKMLKHRVGDFFLFLVLWSQANINKPTNINSSTVGVCSHAYILAWEYELLVDAAHEAVPV